MSQLKNLQTVIQEERLENYESIGKEKFYDCLEGPALVKNKINPSSSQNENMQTQLEDSDSTRLQFDDNDDDDQYFDLPYDPNWRTNLVDGCFREKPEEKNDGGSWFIKGHTAVVTKPYHLHPHTEHTEPSPHHHRLSTVQNTKTEEPLRARFPERTQRREERQPPPSRIPQRNTENRAGLVENIVDRNKLTLGQRSRPSGSYVTTHAPRPGGTNAGTKVTNRTKGKLLLPVGGATAVHLAPPLLQTPSPRPAPLQKSQQGASLYGQSVCSSAPELTSWSEGGHFKEPPTPSLDRQRAHRSGGYSKKWQRAAEEERSGGLFPEQGVPPRGAFTVLPPIGEVRAGRCDAAEVMRSSSDGYLLVMERQQQSISEQADQMKRQTLHLKRIEQQNKRISRIPFPAAKDSESNDKKVPRTKALEYAKTIPKPRLPPKHSPIEAFLCPKAPPLYVDGLDSAHIHSLELLMKRHEEEKQAVALYGRMPLIEPKY